MVLESDEWADENGDLDMFGYQWRSWASPEADIDQISQVVELKLDSRRIVSAWNVGEIDQMDFPYVFSILCRWKTFYGVPRMDIF